MPQIGGKPKVSKTTKTPKKKKSSSSTTKRRFTVVIGSKEYGLYVSSSPSSAARKAVSKLCATDKKRKVSFHIREITQKSEKKTYGPYLGYIEKLAKPIELKGRIIKYNIHVEKIREKTFTKKKMNIKGGLHPTCDNNTYSYNNLLTNLGVSEESKEKYQTKEKRLLKYSNKKEYNKTLENLKNDNSLTEAQKMYIKMLISDSDPFMLNKIRNQCVKYRESLINPLKNQPWIPTYLMEEIHKKHINNDILSKKLNKLRQEIKEQKRSENSCNKRKRINEGNGSFLHKISTQFAKTVARSVNQLRGRKEKED